VNQDRFCYNLAMQNYSWYTNKPDHQSSDYIHQTLAFGSIKDIQNLKKEIGEGDVVDMKISDTSRNQDLINELAKEKDVISVVEINGRINIRALNAVAKLPMMMQTVERLDVQVADISVRQNTLEDVFIDLTGTGLRE